MLLFLPSASEPGLSDDERLDRKKRAHIGAWWLIGIGVAVGLILLAYQIQMNREADRIFEQHFAESEMQ